MLDSNIGQIESPSIANTISKKNNIHFEYFEYFSSFTLSVCVLKITLHPVIHNCILRIIKVF